MKISIHAVLTICAVSGIAMVSAPASANLIQNGGFEDPSLSYSSTSTPPGWTNVGHSDGVIDYSIGPLPSYEGNYFYDLGGYGNASGPIGDGIQQRVATVIGSEYELIFGLSSEDVNGNSTLRVIIDSVVTDFPLTSTGTYFLKGFTTQSISYIAANSFTTISFIESANSSGGNNDPLIDCVSFDLKGVAAGCGRVTNVPEPATLALLGLALAGLGFARRRKLH